MRIKRLEVKWIDPEKEWEATRQEALLKQARAEQIKFMGRMFKALRDTQTFLSLVKEFTPYPGNPINVNDLQTEINSLVTREKL